MNLAILDPVSYCQNNPTLVTSCFVFGDQVTGANSGMPVLVDFPYSAGANTAVDADYPQPSTHTLMSPAGGLGTVFGVRYNRAALGRDIATWDDIFKMNARVAWLDESRPMFGFALRVLGYDPNTTDPTQIAEAEQYLIDHAANLIPWL